MNLLYNGYWVFPGGKVRPGCAGDHSPPSSAAVTEEYTSIYHLGHTGPVTGTLYLFFFDIYLYSHGTHGGRQVLTDGYACAVQTCVLLLCPYIYYCY